MRLNLDSFLRIFRSSELKCPKNYDNHKFNIILLLFKYVDNNGNRVLENEELQKFVNIFYNEEVCDKLKKIKELQEGKNERLNIVTDNLKNALKNYVHYSTKKNGSDKLTIEQKCVLINKEEKYRLFINAIVYTFTNKIVKLKLDIDLINKLDRVERVDKYLLDVGKNLKNIGFRHFFNFMKHKDVATIYDELSK